MKSHNPVAAAVLLTGFLTLVCSGETARPSIHLHGGMAFPGHEKIDSSLESGFGFTYPLAQRLFLSFDFSFWKSAVTESPQNLFNGSLSVTPFLLSLEFFPIPEKILRPYLCAGTGFVFSSFRIGRYISIPEVKISQKIKSGPAGLIGGGLEFRARKNINLAAEVSYLFRHAAGQTIVSDMNFGITTQEFSLNLNSLLFKVVLRYSL